MARHEFGIMKTDPIKGVRYDDYVPEKYDCISVDDEYIEPICGELMRISSYSHTLDIPTNGLVYTGITLIPPAALNEFIDVIKDVGELLSLRLLLMRAKRENRFVIHFGL